MNPVKFVARATGVVALMLATSTSAFAAPVAITTLFNTGVDANGQPLPNGTVTDPHYSLVSVPAGSSTDTRVIDPTGGFPFPNYFVGGNASRWIVANNPSGGSNAGDGSPPGTYVFRTTFDLTGLDYNSALISGGWVSDNNGLDILINGISLGLTNTGAFGSGFTAFSVTSNFIAGVNTLDFMVRNAGSSANGNPVGLRVEMRGTANEIPEPASLGLVLLAGVVAASARRRRA